jgi:hypothetical protein
MKRKILLCQESNPGSPAYRLVTTMSYLAPLSLKEEEEHELQVSQTKCTQKNKTVMILDDCVTTIRECINRHSDHARWKGCPVP